MSNSANPPPEPLPPQTALIGTVLAGGKSLRMGSDKANLLLPSGDRFLQHAIKRLLTVCSQVVVAGRSSDHHPSEAALDSKRCVQFIPDRFPDLGPAGGVATAVQWASQDPNIRGLLVIPLDMPGIASDHLSELIETFSRHPDRPIAATFDGSFAEPMLAIYPCCFSDSLQQLAASKSRSLSRWLANADPILVSLPKTVPANLNTPEQYQQYLDSHS